MRKLLFGMVLLVSFLCILLSAQAETYVLDDLMATVDIPDTYVVITPDTIANYADWLAAKDLSSEALVNDMLKRGVLLRAWDQEDEDRVFELTATQDDETRMVFDVNEQTEDYRRAYRTSYYPKNEYEGEGYTFASSTWKHADNGRFLILEYIMRQYGEIDHRGYMRRTIRNGYEITLDMQVYNRRQTTKDNTALNKIWDAFKFVEILDLPAAAKAQINITETPAKETNVADFAISGTAAEGAQFTAVVMGLNYADKIQTDVEVGRDGKLSIPISLPKEGVFMITVTASYGGEVVAELAYPVTYQRTLLAVNIQTDIPETVSSDSLTITGTAEPKAEIQVFVNDERIETRNVSSDGRFTIELDTSEEGTYEVVLAFSKQDLADRRINITFSRSWSAEDMIKRIKDDAVSPSRTLIRSPQISTAMTAVPINYRCYLVSVTQSGDDWIYKMALSKNGDTYSKFILVIAGEEPKYNIGDRLMMYGTSVGMSVADTGGTVDGEETTSESYPCFELLLLTTIE